MSKLCALVTIALCLGPIGVWAQQQKAPADKQASVRVQGANPDAAAEQATEATPYVIGPLDVLDVNVWQDPNVSRSVPVRPDGRISLPLLNDVQAAGLTPMELSASISAKLKKFLTNPQVTVTVTAMNSQRVYGVGEVNRPGPLTLLPKMTALQAISAAGGITQFGDQKHAYVLRHEGDKDSTFPLNYRDLLRGDMRGNIVLKAGDTIVVP